MQTALFLALCVVLSQATLQISTQFVDGTENVRSEQLVWLTNTNAFSADSSNTITNVEVSVSDPFQRAVITPHTFQAIGGVSAGATAPVYFSIDGPAQDLPYELVVAATFTEHGKSKSVVSIVPFNIHKRGQSRDVAALSVRNAAEVRDNGCAAGVDQNGATNNDIITTSCDFSAYKDEGIWNTWRSRVAVTVLNPTITYTLTPDITIPVSNVTQNWQSNWKLNNTETLSSSFFGTPSACGSFNIQFKIQYYIPATPVPRAKTWIGTYQMLVTFDPLLCSSCACGKREALEREVQIGRIKA